MLSKLSDALKHPVHAVYKSPVEVEAVRFECHPCESVSQPGGDCQCLDADVVVLPMNPVFELSLAAINQFYGHLPQRELRTVGKDAPDWFIAVP